MDIRSVGVIQNCGFCTTFRFLLPYATVDINFCLIMPVLELRLQQLTITVAEVLPNVLGVSFIQFDDRTAQRSYKRS